MDERSPLETRETSEDAAARDPADFDLEGWAAAVNEERRRDLERDYSAYGPDGDSFASAVQAAGLDSLLSTEWLNGTRQADVIYYGRLYRWNGSVWAYEGMGICVWAYVSTAPGCRGGLHYTGRWLNPTAYPLGIRGDLPGGSMGGDRIYPAGGLGFGTVGGNHGVDCDPGPGPYTCGTDRQIFAPVSTATFHICGDDCSIGGGTSDHVVGWRGGDTLMGGGGADRLLGEDVSTGIGGSDSLYGDDGSDHVWGYWCSAGVREYLSGGNGDDWVVPVCESMPNASHVACPRDILGGPGNDALNGGLGDDKIEGGPGNDRGTDDPAPSPPAPAGWQWIHGWQGNDQMSGGDGYEYLSGDEGNDVLYSDNTSSPGYSEILSGGVGTDYLYGDSFGTLTCDGGYGSGFPEPTDFCDPSPYCDTRIDCEW